MEEKTKVNKNKSKDSQDRNNKMNIVKNLLDKGKKNGVLTYQEILDEVENIELSPEQIEKIYEVLESMGIEVQGAANEIDIVEEEIDLSVPEGIAIDDPVRMYLKEIGRSLYYLQKKKWSLLKRLKKEVNMLKRNLLKPILDLL